jgi:hypothetical protein
MKVATYNILKGGSQRVHWVRVIQEFGVDCQATFFSPVQRQSDFLIILSTRSASDDN